jgi:hypothetical protein
MKVVRKLARRYCDWRCRRLPQRCWSTLGLGVVVAVRNRSGQRPENFLRTLRHQTMPPDMVDITLVDYGSDPEHAQDLQDRCLDWRVRYIYLPVPSHLERRRGLALNVGLRRMPEWCRVAMCTDIDMLFARDFLEWVMRTQLAYPRALTLCRFVDLRQEAISPETDVVAQFDQIKTQGEYYDDSAVGPCLGAPRAWFHHIRGFDERLFGEDHDDTDIRWRNRRDGRIEVRLEDRTSLLHQWHWRRFEQAESAEQKLDAESYHRYWDSNMAIVQGDQSVIRNLDHEWGQLPEGGYVIEPPERRR